MAWPARIAREEAATQAWWWAEWWWWTVEAHTCHMLCHLFHGTRHRSSASAIPMQSECASRPRKLQSRRKCILTAKEVHISRMECTQASLVGSATWSIPFWLAVFGYVRHQPPAAHGSKVTVTDCVAPQIYKSTGIIGMQLGWRVGVYELLLCGTLITTISSSGTKISASP